MGFMLVSAVLVVSFGRVGDMYGRVKMYNPGVRRLHGLFHPVVVDLDEGRRRGPVDHLHADRPRRRRRVPVRHSSAILTDAFPENERGKAMGINGVALVTGSFLGLILGGCSHRSTGGSSSSSRCPSGSSARSGPT